MPLATGLPAGSHEVMLMVRGFNEYQTRWTPPLVSCITFLGLDVTGGALQPSARPARPKMEFLGDSITEGLYIWSTYNGQTTVPWRADAPISWASQTAQSLGAEWRQVGFGVQGLLKGGSGGVPAANQTFNWIYEGVPRDSWQPDMVVINQGTNDGGSTRDGLPARLHDVHRHGRRAIPAPRSSPCARTTARTPREIQAEVNARGAAGDSAGSSTSIRAAGWGTATSRTASTPTSRGARRPRRRWPPPFTPWVCSDRRAR